MIISAVNHDLFKIYLKMPVSLNRLSEGWLELESDPGLFSLLLEDFGVKGVQVEEIYDIQKSIEGPVFGFIFLFKWIEERRSRRKIVFGEEAFVREELTVNSIFFAHQIVPNSCATHSLLSVLLNCESMYLGDTLTRLKDYTMNMTPENKGYAIGNTPELARAHNSHAKLEPKLIQEKPHGFPTSRIVDAFHFVSFVPIKGRLFELDGLKPFPIDHGEWDADEDWTEKFRRVITERLGISNVGEPCHDIRFNLMAVVPDRKIAYEQKLKTLKINRQIVLEALQQLVKVTKPKSCSELSQEKLAEVANFCSGENNSSKNDQKSDSNLNSTVVKAAAPMRSTSTSSNSSSSSFSSIHPALDTHDYAKSPLTEVALDENEPRLRDDDEQPVSSSANGNILLPPPKLVQSGPGSTWPLAPNTTSPIPLRPIMVSTKDFSKPLSIQTKFETSPTPSCSSTDTSSEVGSAFNSPVRPLFYNSSQNSPNVKDFKRFVVIHVSGSRENPTPEQSPDAATAIGGTDERASTSSCYSSSYNGTATSLQKRPIGELGNEAIPASKCIKQKQLQPSPKQEVSSSTNEAPLISASEGGSGFECKNAVIAAAATSTVHVPPPFTASPHNQSKESPKYPPLIEPHAFAPKDLLALLKNIESEILTCESALKDEIEKQRKYKIDDCRRTHNYENFISTFLSLLDEHGKLKELVEQHTLIKRRQGVNAGRIHKVKKPQERKRKPRGRKKK